MYWSNLKNLIIGPQTPTIENLLEHYNSSTDIYQFFYDLLSRQISCYFILESYNKQLRNRISSTSNTISTTSSVLKMFKYKQKCLITY